MGVGDRAHAPIVPPYITVMPLPVTFAWTACADWGMREGVRSLRVDDQFKHGASMAPKVIKQSVRSECTNFDATNTPLHREQIVGLPEDLFEGGEEVPVFVQVGGHGG